MTQSESKVVKVTLPEAERHYNIVIGQGFIDQASALIQAQSDLGKRTCIIVTDSNVAPLYLDKIEAALKTDDRKVLKSIVFPSGEANKTLDQTRALWTDMFNAHVDRKTVVVALGGGVTGDLAGYASADIHRGIDFIQIPTTLLAQVDSSVGGKTGVDTPWGKNTIGAFHQPSLVLIDVDMLKTLPKRELLAGYAEVVKYGLINDRAFFDWCVDNGEKIVEGDTNAQIQAIKYSCAAKAKIVEADEREAGPRALLNLGHTFGHALEAAAEFGSTSEKGGPLLVHGEAVAIGTVMAFRMAVKMGLCPEKDYNDVREHFEKIGLPVFPPAFEFDADTLVTWMEGDKKTEGGKITLILPHGIGDAVTHKNVDKGEIKALWEEVLSSRPNPAAHTRFDKKASL